MILEIKNSLQFQCGKRHIDRYNNEELLCNSYFGSVSYGDKLTLIQEDKTTDESDKSSPLYLFTRYKIRFEKLFMKTDFHIFCQK